MWPEVATDFGALEPGWITAKALFADKAAIAEYLDYEGSFHAGTDRKTCAAAMMADYSYMLSMATVPLFAGFAIVPDLSPAHVALKFYTTPLEHDGLSFEVRRAHVRFLSPAFFRGANGPAEEVLCDLYRRAIETHFDPLVKRLHGATGLSRSALWRLVADSIAGRFLDAGRRFDRLEPAKASAMTILKSPGSPLDNRQLHYFDLTVTDGGRREISRTFRARGGCCRYYTVEGGALCSTCVLNNPGKRDEQLRRGMRRRLGMTADTSSGAD